MPSRNSTSARRIWFNFFIFLRSVIFKIMNHRAVTILCIAIVLGSYNDHAFANDLFVGKFASETRDNFGTDKSGEYEIEVVRRGENFNLSVSQNGKFLFDVEAAPCSPEKEDYLRDRPPGDAYVLCNTSMRSSAFVYSQNGIKVPMIGTHYKVQYYAHIQWGFYGFRKVQ